MKGNSNTVPAAGVPAAQLRMLGNIHGGQQPINGASIQLYSAGTAGDASAATPLLMLPVTSDQSGNFSITSDYTCPSSTVDVYLVATGGNPGLSMGTNNSAIALMTAVGQCGNLNASTFIFVNEVTTIGSLAALYPYMNSATQLGSGPSDLVQFATAFDLVNQYINTTTGTTPGPTRPPGFDPSSLKINTLADIVAACVNSAGGSAGDGSPCGNLFALTTPPGGAAPTNTIVALLNILNYPQQNVGVLCQLAPPSSPFQPSLSCPPISWINWTLPIIPATAAGELEARTTTNKSAFYGTSA